MIVSDIAGTTRDAVDTRIENEHGVFNFIDTAGIRRHSKVEDRIEKFSVLRANMAVERADVCILMIDAGDGITEQDEKIAGISHEAGKACIIAVNKWDTVEKDNSTTNNYNREIKTALSYMPYAPIVYLSAKTGQRVQNLYPLIKSVYADGRNAGLDHNRTNVRFTPRTAVSVMAVRHRTLTGNGQHTVFQCPGHILTAAAAVSRSGSRQRRQ